MPLNFDKLGELNAAKLIAAITNANIPSTLIDTASITDDNDQVILKTCLKSPDITFEQRLSVLESLIGESLPTTEMTPLNIVACAIAWIASKNKLGWKGPTCGIMLHSYVILNDTNVVQFLMDMGEDANARDYFDSTPLSLAISLENDCYDVITRHPNYKPSKNIAVALLAAAHKKDREKFTWLLNQANSINLFQHYPETLRITDFRSRNNTLETLLQQMSAISNDSLSNSIEIAEPTTLLPIRFSTGEKQPIKINTIELIQQGGYATVYKALWDGNPVALKIMRKELRSTYLNETFIHSKLHHPSIPTLYHAFEHTECYGLLLEWSSEGSLYDRINYTIAPEQTYQWLQDIASALKYTHDRGMIHCDIKLDNVLLYHGRAKLSDYGLATTTADESAIQNANTRLYVTMALHIKAPELWIFPKQAITPKADIFSFGFLMWELCLPTPMWPLAVFKQGFTNASLLSYLIGEHRPPVTPIRKEYAKLIPLFNQCWQVAPENRPETGHLFKQLSHLNETFETPNPAYKPSARPAK